MILEYARRFGWVAAALMIGMVPRPARAGEPSKLPASPAEAVNRLTLPPGFKAALCAAEPDVVQPIAMALDARGRLWVVENRAYPIWLGGPTGQDRILIFEDTNGDGRFDRRTVFFDKGTNYTGIELGYGGVWVCATPNLLFFPDRNGDDQPDGPPVVKLDGWNVKAQHNLFNALKWGPDGWLWGCHGILSTALVGKPGTPDSKRVAMNCGVWRYHPTREVFEVVAHGTTNPWGLDFDDRGEAFITNCVIAHLFRVTPGAHFDRMYGQDFNPHLYELMATCADHLHWAGGKWQDAREGNALNEDLGGGHAHVGGMIYLADNWPAKYRDTLFTVNIHGHRVNNDRLVRLDDGARIVGRHEPDFLRSSDSWFRGLELKYGPDGGVYVTDWSDIGECHENDADNAHRETGRIFKVTFGDPKPVKVDLALRSDRELARFQSHPNEWYVRTARRILQERAAAGQDLGPAHQILREMLDDDTDVRHRLRALWTLHATGGLDEPARLQRLGDPSPEIRAWSVRLLVDDGRPSDTAIGRLSAMAYDGPSGERSPLVRLYLASAMQRIPVEKRWEMAMGLFNGAPADLDADQTRLIWYGVEPLVAADPFRAWGRLMHSRNARLHRFLARRMVEKDLGAMMPAVLGAISEAGLESSPSIPRSILDGVLEAVAGRKRVEMPKWWPDIPKPMVAKGDAEIRAKLAALGLLFGDPAAEAGLRAIVEDRGADVSSRQFAMRNLVDRRAAGLPPVLFRLLDDEAMRAPAIRALAAFNDPKTPATLLKRYPNLTPAERDDAIATLASRPAWARAMIEAIDSGTIPRRDVSTTIARQVLAFGDGKLTEAMEKAWGSLRPTARDKAPLIAKYHAILADRRLPPANLGRGRLLFGRMCGQCHRLYGEGGDLGPDLTGSDRANPDYILQNVLDPSASVGKDYTMTTVATVDGRLISGIVREQTPAGLVIQTATDRVTIPREDVEAIKPSSVSMMPEGQLDPLAPLEIRDLFAYLAIARPLRRD